MKFKQYSYRKIEEQFILFPIYGRVFYNLGNIGYRTLYNEKQKLFGNLDLPEPIKNKSLDLDSGRFTLDLWITESEFKVLDLIDEEVPSSPFKMRWNQLLNLTNRTTNLFKISNREALKTEINRCKEIQASILMTPLNSTYTDNSCFIFKC